MIQALEIAPEGQKLIDTNTLGKCIIKYWYHGTPCLVRTTIVLPSESDAYSLIPHVYKAKFGI